jgi:uncharacterized protein (TIGR03083 family)
MISNAIAVESIAPLEHDEAMRLATAEYERLLAVVDGLGDEDWSRPTDCTDWDVKSMLGHVLGALELQADADERLRQLSAAGATAAETGCLRLDAMTALQVREHAALTPNQLREALREAAPHGLAARRANTPALLDTPYDPQLPGESGWTFGYLYDVIHTRDPWIHRVDISRAIGREMVLSSEHDGRIIADVVTDWARRHRQPFTLRLSGPAGGVYTAGENGQDIDLDAVEFCRILSGRAKGSGLLAVRVVF